MRRLKLLAVTVILTALALAGVVWGTTYHTINVASFAGNLAGDFAADEKTAGDPPNDSLYGVNNELTTLYVTWDAQKLYLGYDFKITGGAVMYLLNTSASGGVTNLCHIGSGYNGAFPANAQSPGTQPFNFMVAFWADQSNGSVPNMHVYALGNNNSTEITSSPGVAKSLVQSVAGTNQRTGSVEVAIPWDVMYGLGAGKVPAGATIKIAGVLRGNNNDDGLGDVSPNPTSAVQNQPCGTTGYNYIDNYFTFTVDANGDGTPETGWRPGSNSVVPDSQPAVDAMVPDTKPPADGKAPADTKPAADAKPAGDAKLAADTKAPADTKPPADTKRPADAKPPADTKPITDTKRPPDSKIADRSLGGDRATSDRKGPSAEGRVGADQLVVADASMDQKPATKVDAGKKKTSDAGCACRASGDGKDLVAGLLPLALLALAVGLRRRRREPTR